MNSNTKQLGIGLLAALLLLTALPVSATSQTEGPWPASIRGYVYGKNLVRGPNGQPIFAEFAPDGSVIREIGEATLDLTRQPPRDLTDAYVISASNYNTYVENYNRFKAQYGQGDAEGAYILDVNSYYAKYFTTFDNKPITSKPDLASSTRSVLVRNTRKIFTESTSPILLQSPIDLKNIKILQPLTKSVLLNNRGQVEFSSVANIGYRTAALKPLTEGEESNCYPAYGWRDDNRTFRRVGEDEPCGPIAGATIKTDILPGLEGGTVSDQSGFYTLNYLNLPCPGFDFEFTHAITSIFYYNNFNPRANENGPGLGMYYQTSYITDWCFGSADNLSLIQNPFAQDEYNNVLGVLATQASPARYLDITPDVIVLTGKGRIANGLQEETNIPLDVTRYSDTLTHLYQAPQSLDIDGNGSSDITEICDYDNNGIEEVGVYFGTNRPANLADCTQNNPDVIQLMNTIPEFEDGGLLESISEEDLLDTDIYIYRTSNGQLITEHKGLNEEEYRRGQATGLSEGSTFYYRSTIRGPSGHASYFGLDFKAWQTKANMDPAFYQRKADHLRIGEAVKIVAVNRKTGYIGTVVTQVQNAATNTESNNNVGKIDFPIDDIVMRPPNIKVRVERQYDVLTGDGRGDEKNYVIGFEGSALKTDKIIRIYTEWFDHNGEALPNRLPGFTGRIAKIVSDKTLGDSIATFEIKPGYKTQIIQLPSTAVGNDHYYLHISATPKEDHPDFSSSGQASNSLLASRPKYYVPFKVAFFDETETRQRRNALAGAGGSNNVDSSADALYQWFYRPEMQFSIYSLDVSRIQEGNDSGPGTTQITSYEGDVILDYPEIDFNALYLDLDYNLSGSQYLSLDPFGPPRELVFSLGAEEIAATITDDGTIRFDDLQHLASLSDSDLLAVRLYQNSDMENILWQYNFKVPDLDIDSDNNNGFDQPEGSSIEDKIEDLAGSGFYPGKMVQPNINDQDMDGIPDFADMAYMMPLTKEQYRPRFVPIVLQLPTYIDITRATIKLEYSGSDPNQVGGPTDQNPNAQYIAAPGVLRVWRTSSFSTRSPVTDYIVPGQTYSATELGFTVDRGFIVLYVEGVRQSTTVSDQLIRLVVDVS